MDDECCRRRVLCCFICPNIGLTPASDYLSRSNNANRMQRERPRVATPLRKVRIWSASVILPSPALNLLLRLTMESVGLPAAALSGQRPAAGHRATVHCPSLRDGQAPVCCAQTPAFAQGWATARLAPRRDPGGRPGKGLLAPSPGEPARLIQLQSRGAPALK